ncbi:recombination regulator RecX [Lysobacter auxotrophicus]|uniref:Regulatory protein RecX n=1 Tax=Lysobacter auxotrophicus TaxID=2992573 RepID=A0ABN6UIY4_9GAMM|nr:recombination regulator RecX [Lysobacter auxotrophicus]BDU16065.1 recombination regulator RecX [Lysobacter auxotrophicus]
MHDDRGGGGDPGEAPGRRRRVREQTPVQRALGLLARREHSRKELNRKLTSRGLDAEEVQAAVDRLAGEGWQDDTRFAESLVRSRAASGYGPLRIRAELSTHGLDGEAIARAMATFEGDWKESARDLVRRRFGKALEELAQRRKAADFLIRRGFDGDSVRAATRLDLDD